MSTNTMPETRPIDDGFAVTGQLHPDQMTAVAEAGYKGLICNRPDGEAPAEPQYEPIRAAAEAAGMTVRYVPVSNQVGITPDNVQAMRAALDELDGPILAYCRSGARSAKLYEIAKD
ncbi:MULTISPECIES: TIGR01244 family sulfur transferase [unclassified Roseitalea]|uniref:TIGR01244 family sulfur transferase n=1 Tax=unclassified Roseitalea TaxID=2639107 RepID=UPI00273D5F89|nr:MULTISPECIES: TIGR01244 family sulfur transferase [unclassified Roseitalea]